MSQFPVEDTVGMLEGINYLLSGPAGLGQNFQGFSDYRNAFLTGTTRAPFSTTAAPGPSLYVAPINIDNITPQGASPTRYIEIDFTSAGLSDPPFSAGDTVTISGVTDDASGEVYDGTYGRSVVSCTNTTLILQTNKAYTWSVYISGGTVEKDQTNTNNSTDCNAKVTVYGPTDRVFVTAQLNLAFTYTCTTASEWDIRIKINRYRGEPTQTPNDNDYLFDLDVNPLVSEQVTHYSESTSGTASNVEYIFTTVLDQPSFGYYWYILDVDFNTYDPTQGGLLDQPMGSTAIYTYTGTAATQAMTATYAGIVPTTLTGIGSGADVDVVLLEGTSTAYAEQNVRITVNSGGSDYQPGDQISILGTALGGASPANDMTLTIQEIDPQAYPGDAKPGVFTMGLRSFTAQVIKA